jgi:hypothetical protein
MRTDLGAVALRIVGSTSDNQRVRALSLVNASKTTAAGTASVLLFDVDDA